MEGTNGIAIGIAQLALSEPVQAATGSLTQGFERDGFSVKVDLRGIENGSKSYRVTIEGEPGKARDQMLSDLKNLLGDFRGWFPSSSPKILTLFWNAYQVNQKWKEIISDNNLQ